MPVQKDDLRRGDEAAFQIPDRIPIFPLPSAVFFPRTYLPLHIFEPRYRQMVADAADHGQCIGMALLKDGWENAYYGHPPVHQVGCVGRLVTLRRLEDGRSNIVLYGLSRYDILQEFYDKPYRQATIRLRHRPSTSLDASLRVALLKEARRYVGRSADEAPWRYLWDRDVTGDETLVNGLSCCLDFTVVEKQFLLEAEDLPQQARRLHDLIRLKADRPAAKG